MWLLLLVVMVGNGVFRVVVLQPRLGEHFARQAACFSGIGLILAMTGLFVRRLADPTTGQLFKVGLFWLALTLAFEFFFGYVSDQSWETLLAEYNLPRGRLWPLVLLTTLLAPWLWGIARSGRVE